MTYLIASIDTYRSKKKIVNNNDCKDDLPDELIFAGFIYTNFVVI